MPAPPPRKPPRRPPSGRRASGDHDGTTSGGGTGGGGTGGISGKGTVAPETYEDLPIPVIGKKYPTNCVVDCYVRFPTLLLALFLFIPLILSIMALNFDTVVDADPGAFEISDHETAQALSSVAAVRNRWERAIDDSRANERAVRTGSERTQIFTSVKVAYEVDVAAARAYFSRTITDPSQHTSQYVTQRLNLFHEANVAYIRSVEAQLLALAEYPKFCWSSRFRGGANDNNVYSFPACTPPTSAMTYFYPGRLVNDTVGGPYWQFDLSGNGQPQTPTDKVANLFFQSEDYRWFVDQAATPQRQIVSVLRSEFNLGTPIVVNNRLLLSPESMIDDFLLKMVDVLSVPPMHDFIRVSFGGDRVLEALTKRVADGDLTRVMLSLLILFPVLWYYFHSFALALLSTVQLLLTYPAGFFIFASVTEPGPGETSASSGTTMDGTTIKKISLLTALSYIITLVVAVNGMMVFFDTFRQSAFMPTSGRRNLLTVGQRAAYTFRRAGLGISVASLITIVCFLVNTASKVPAVRDFALMAAIFAILNWVLLLTYFPAAVLFHHFHVSRRRRNLQKQKEVLLQRGLRQRDPYFSRFNAAIEGVNRKHGAATFEKLSRQAAVCEQLRRRDQAREHKDADGIVRNVMRSLGVKNQDEVLKFKIKQKPTVAGIFNRVERDNNDDDGDDVDELEEAESRWTTGSGFRNLFGFVRSSPSASDRVNHFRSPKTKLKRGSFESAATEMAEVGDVGGGENGGDATTSSLQQQQQQQKQQQLTLKPKKSAADRDHTIFPQSDGIELDEDKFLDMFADAPPEEQTQHHHTNQSRLDEKRAGRRAALLRVAETPDALRTRLDDVVEICGINCDEMLAFDDAALRDRLIELGHTDFGKFTYAETAEVAPLVGVLPTRPDRMPSARLHTMVGVALPLLYGKGRTLMPLNLDQLKVAQKSKKRVTGDADARRAAAAEDKSGADDGDGSKNLSKHAVAAAAAAAADAEEEDRAAEHDKKTMTKQQHQKDEDELKVEGSDDDDDDDENDGDNANNGGAARDAADDADDEDEMSPREEHAASDEGEKTNEDDSKNAAAAAASEKQKNDAPSAAAAAAAAPSTTATAFAAGSIAANIRKYYLKQTLNGIRQYEEERAERAAAAAEASEATAATAAGVSQEEQEQQQQQQPPLRPAPQTQLQSLLTRAQTWWHDRTEVQRENCCGYLGKRVNETAEERRRRVMAKSIKHESYTWMERFFHNEVVTFLDDFKIVFVLLLLALLIMSSVFVSRLAFTARAPAFLGFRPTERYDHLSRVFADTSESCDFCSAYFQPAKAFPHASAGAAGACAASGKDPLQHYYLSVDQCGACGTANACLDCFGTPSGSRSLDTCTQCTLAANPLRGACSNCLYTQAAPASCSWCAQKQAKPGYGGSACQVRCDATNCVHGTCHPLTGACECHQTPTRGFWAGASCTVCMAGFFGADCLSECSVVVVVGDATTTSGPAPCVCNATTKKCTACPYGYGGGDGCVSRLPHICHPTQGTPVTTPSAACQCVAGGGFGGPTCAGFANCSGHGKMYWPADNAVPAAAAGAGSTFLFPNCACFGNWRGPTCDVCRCYNGGSCDERTGACVCAAGWGGPSCQECSPACQTRGSCPVPYNKTVYPFAACKAIWCTDAELAAGAASFAPCAECYTYDAQRTGGTLTDTVDSMLSHDCKCRGNWAAAPGTPSGCTVCNTTDASNRRGVTCRDSDGALVGCDGNPKTAGDWATLDECGVCSGGATQAYQCPGCDGVPGSTKLVDSCGVCGGFDECLAAASGEQRATLVRPQSKVLITFGINGQGSTSAVAATDARDALGRGVPDAVFDAAFLDPRFDLASVRAQQRLLWVCSELGSASAARFVRASQTRCFVADWATWLLANAQPFPYLGADVHQKAFEFARLAGRFDEIGFNKYDGAAGDLRAQWIAVHVRPRAMFDDDSQDHLDAQYELFHDLEDRINAADTGVTGECVVSSSAFVALFSMRAAQRGTVFVLVLGCSLFVWLCLTITCSPTLTLCSLAVLLSNLLFVLGMFHAADWPVGPVEQVSIALLLGVASERVVHICEGYLEHLHRASSHWFAQETTRLAAVRNMMQRVGVSLATSSVTLVLGTCIALSAKLFVIRHIAVVVIIIVTSQLLFSLILLPCVLLLVGPVTGHVSPGAMLFFFGIGAIVFLVSFVPASASGSISLI